MKTDKKPAGWRVVDSQRVYAIAADARSEYGRRWVKVGRSNNPDRSLKELQPDCPVRAEVVTSIRTDNAEVLEGLFHDFFHAYVNRWIGGMEWFELPDGVIDALRQTRELGVGDAIEWCYDVDASADAHMHPLISPPDPVPKPRNPEGRR